MTTEHQYATAVEPTSHTLNDIARSLGIVPKMDPESGRSFYLWDDMFPMSETGRPIPNFGTQETSKIFFAKGPDWLRWRYHPAADFPDGYFVLDGTILEPKRSNSDQRYYSLADIERMAHALAQNGAIDGERLMSIISLTLLSAHLYEVI